MTAGGSQQLRRFRIAMRDGATVEEAAELVGMSIGEARLTVAEDAKSPPPAEAYEPLPIRNPEAAGCAATNEEEQKMDNDDATDVATLAADTLRGDVRDAMLSWFRPRRSLGRR